MVAGSTKTSNPASSGQEFSTQPAVMKDEGPPFYLEFAERPERERNRIHCALRRGWPVPVTCSSAPNGRLRASRRAAKQAAFCVYKPKAPFKPVFEVATTREDSEVALVHDPEAEPRIADQPPSHGHGLEADSCLWWRRGRVELYCEHGNSVLIAA